MLLLQLKNLKKFMMDNRLNFAAYFYFYFARTCEAGSCV